MKLIFVVATVPSAILPFAPSGFAQVLLQNSPQAQPQPQPQSHYEQLLATRGCQACNLANANFQGLDLKGVDLQGANLSNANLQGANLSGANLQGARLYLTQFQQSNLQNANLTTTNLTGAKLDGAQLQNSNLQGANAAYASFRRADLTGATLDNANLSDAELLSSNLVGASLTQANLSNSNFTGANLSQANLAGVDLTRADWTNAQLPGNAQTAIAQEPSIPTDPAAPPVTSEQSEPLAVDSGAASEEPRESLEDESEARPTSPLIHQPFPQATANHLNRGDVVIGLTNRQFLTSTANDPGSTASFPGVQIDWGVTNSTQLGVALQVVDTGSPGQQGPFSIRREDNLDLTLQLKQRFWQNDRKTLSFSGVAAVAVGKRSYEFRNAPLPRQDNSDIIPAFQLPVTFRPNDRLSLTLSPTVALFPEDNALFLQRVPIANPGSFGTTFGVSGGISYAVHPRLTLWGDAFVPVTGNNSINANTGRPDKAIAFNAGVRYFVNPRLGLDVFASNTFGQRSPLSLTADQDNVAVGVGLSFLPELLSSNRKYGDTFYQDEDMRDSPLTVDGLGLADGGTMPRGRLALQLQGGQQGIFPSFRYGLLRDLEAFGYLDYRLGRVDESEQGFGVKLRLLDQESNGPFTLSAAVSVGLANRVFTNFTNNDPTAFNASGFKKDVPLIFQGDGADGRRFLVGASLPMHYKVNDKLNFWFTPSLGYAQRLGVELGGVNVGGSFEFVKDVSVVAEVGANLLGKGNSFNQTQLVERIPWTFAVRWDPSSAFGFKNENALARPQLELYVTNRNGASIWNQLRVREGGDPAVGVGLFVPF
jgi:uncharacterized protein YjbI with pentapeptide repeats